MYTYYYSTQTDGAQQLLHCHGPIHGAKVDGRPSEEIDGQPGRLLKLFSMALQKLVDCALESRGLPNRLVKLQIRSYWLNYFYLSKANAVSASACFGWPMAKSRSPGHSPVRSDGLSSSRVAKAANLPSNGRPMAKRKKITANRERILSAKTNILIQNFCNV